MKDKIVVSRVDGVIRENYIDSDMPVGIRAGNMNVTDTNMMSASGESIFCPNPLALQLFRLPVTVNPNLFIAVV